MTPVSPRSSLAEAREHIARAREIVERIAPSLPEPSRSALVGILGASHDLTRIERSLMNIATMHPDLR